MTKGVTVLLFLFIWGAAQEQEFVFTKQQLTDDLDHLALQLQKYHPNLHVYASKKEIEGAFSDLKKGLSDSLTQEQSFTTIASSCSIVKDGHYNVIPSSSVVSGFYTFSKLLPIDIYWVGREAYMVKNYSDQTIPMGAKVLSINGIASSVLRDKLLKGTLRDGNNETYPQWILNQFFRAYYLFHVGSSEEFILSLESPSGVEQALVFKGLTSEEVSAVRKSRYPDYDREFNASKGIELEILKEEGVAVLTLLSFENKLLKQEYDQHFKRSIKACMKSIEEQGIEHLIIDLRGNQGGEVTNGVFLLKHLMTSPFESVKGFAKVDKREFESLEERIVPAKGLVEGVHKPFENGYQGAIYLMVNGGSFSCSGIFSQTIKRYKRGKIYGEETGGSAYTTVGAPNKEFVLPHTQFQVTIPQHQFILQEYEGKEKTGVVPDVLITPRLSDVLEGVDAVLGSVLEEIRSSE